MKNILFFDTETVGLPGSMDEPYANHHNWPEIVSIAWLICQQDGTLCNAAQYIIAPRPGVENRAAHINGITHERQRTEGWKISLVLADLLKDFAMCSLAVCHNVQFDQPVLFAELDRLGVEPPTIEWYCTKETAAPLCCIPNTSSRYPGPWKWPSLNELYFYLFSKPIHGREQFHDALTDARAVARCYFEMQKRLSHTEATIL